MSIHCLALADQANMEIDQINQSYTNNISNTAKLIKVLAAGEGRHQDKVRKEPAF